VSFRSVAVNAAGGDGTSQAGDTVQGGNGGDFMVVAGASGFIADSASSMQLQGGNAIDLANTINLKPGNGGAFSATGASVGSWPFAFSACLFPTGGVGAAAGMSVDGGQPGGLATVPLTIPC